MSKITEGDKDLVAGVMSECCQKVAALIEGNFITDFEIDMEIGGVKYKLQLIKIKENEPA